VDTSAIDFPALLLGVISAGLITASVAWGVRREGGRAARLWIAAAVITVVLMGVGFIDLMRARPRETHVAALVIGIPLPVLGAVGLQHAMRRFRPWIRWSVVFVAAFVLLYLGLLIGAAILPRYLGA
jgi:hypothetical protein